MPSKRFNIDDTIVPLVEPVRATGQAYLYVVHAGYDRREHFEQSVVTLRGNRHLTFADYRVAAIDRIAELMTLGPDGNYPNPAPVFAVESVRSDGSPRVNIALWEAASVPSRPLSAAEAVKPFERLAEAADWNPDRRNAYVLVDAWELPIPF